MPDLFATGAKLLQRVQTQFAAARVIYQRGGSGALLSCPATIGKSTYHAENDVGVVIEYEVRDYLILAADLQNVAPVRGDRIIEGDLSNGATYEVSPTPTREPEWSWTDQYRLRFRIHTKYIGQQPIA